MELSNFGLPRKVKEGMLIEYLGGVKIARMLSEESSMILNAVNKMISRYKDRFLPTFAETSVNLSWVYCFFLQTDKRLVTNICQHRSCHERLLSS
jgi:hypothetical protein